MSVFRRAPALFWRAFFLILSASAGTFVAISAPKGQVAPPLTQLGRIDPAEGRNALEAVRRQGIDGDYYLEFQLRVMPRRGEERLIPGQLWGGHNEIGPLSRVTLTLAESGKAPLERRLLIQNGRSSSMWRWETGGAVQMLGVASPFEPVVPDTDLTAFDLQMPFLFWDSFSYEGLKRFRGRPAYVLVLRPPAEFAAKYPSLTGVRVHLDTQYDALVQTELLGMNDVVLKTISLVDLKKVGEQWIPKTFDVRDEKTRNKTRFDVIAAALNLDFSRMIFEPAQLDEPLRPPSTPQLVRLDK